MTTRNYREDILEGLAEIGVRPEHREETLARYIASLSADTVDRVAIVEALSWHEDMERGRWGYEYAEQQLAALEQRAAHAVLTGRTYEQTVEAAAAALYYHSSGTPPRPGLEPVAWDKLPKKLQETHRATARVALRAAQYER